jgi:hypothetical protein
MSLVHQVVVLILYLSGAVFALGVFGVGIATAFVLFGSEEGREARRVKAIPWIKICTRISRISWAVGAAIAVGIVLFGFLSGLLGR